MPDHNEVEVKIPLVDRADAVAKLEALGFRESAPRVWEANDVYDTTDQALRQQGMLLRLRRAGDHSVLTWKGPNQPAAHKSRRELETSLGSTEVCGAILEQLGYSRVFRYEKYRTEYAPGDRTGVVTVDETPIGDFLEIEGPPEWIDETADRLGFSSQNYVLKSYGALYIEHCREHGLEPTNMVFASHASEG